MFLTLQVVTVFLVAVAMSLSLAHALELPGKMRLDKETYIAVQSIYYPGFTFGGLGEGLGMLATLVLLLMTPTNVAAFWWTLTSVIALVAMQAVYWSITHPVNKFWLKDTQLEGAAGGFFTLDPMKRGAASEDGSEGWKEASGPMGVLSCLTSSPGYCCFDHSRRSHCKVIIKLRLITECGASRDHRTK